MQSPMASRTWLPDHMYLEEAGSAEWRGEQEGLHAPEATMEMIGLPGLFNSFASEVISQVAVAFSGGSLHQMDLRTGYRRQGRKEGRKIRILRKCHPATKPQAKTTTEISKPTTRCGRSDLLPMISRISWTQGFVSFGGVGVGSGSRSRLPCHGPGMSRRLSPLQKTDSEAWEPPSRPAKHRRKIIHAITDDGGSGSQCGEPSQCTKAGLKFRAILSPNFNLLISK